mmetsp:Transcript_6074/g.13226  ORF Transcript_6074/g.13226 Transcript_6074/m.13226 type:complete len:370 (+) Transcript_6074:245-1354(+)|eukprot:CAMPEP_0178514030 /NCGR_PEP_ID=MMETSP0696-20121128/23799_1 /TAXON_ID=265572 /ORGANISM="Extubocellulus spinifer, Strain CCMP396" /LENGTH=369 /DNA_ID=CAMNT_0020144085 /DNA_START=84 /DNA_END=1193 /DNA_ORIENTATION=-
MSLPRLTAEQIQEDRTHRIFSAAVQRALSSHNEQLLEPGADTSLMRHARSVAAEMPATVDESYVLQLQSQLALALHSMERMHEDRGDENDDDGENDEPTASSSARELANAAARRGRRRHHRRHPCQEDRDDENDASLSLGLLASLQVDLSITRERMSDALSVARSHSHRSHSQRSIIFGDSELLNDIDPTAAANEDDEMSLDLADLNGLVVGPLEQGLNDVESEPEQAEQHAGNNDGSNPHEDEMIASIAALQVDLLQTKEKLMDERSFNKSGHSRTADDTLLNDITLDASSSAMEANCETTTGAAAASPAPSQIADTAAADPRDGGIEDAASRLEAMNTAPKDDAAVTGTGMSANDSGFRPFISSKQA